MLRWEVINKLKEGIQNLKSRMNLKGNLIRTSGNQSDKRLHKTEARHLLWAHIICHFSLSVLKRQPETITWDSLPWSETITSEGESWKLALKLCRILLERSYCLSLGLSAHWDPQCKHQGFNQNKGLMPESISLYWHTILTFW